MGLLDGDLAEIISDGVADIMLDGTLHKVVLTDDGRGAFSEVWTDYPVKGFDEDYSDFYRVQLGIPETDVKLIVLQFGVSVPIIDNDQLTLRGTRYALSKINQDPAQATWTMNGRPV